MSIKAVKKKEKYQDTETFQEGMWVRGMELSGRALATHGQGPEFDA